MWFEDKGELRVEIVPDNEVENPRYASDRLGKIIGYSRSFDICDEIPKNVDAYESWEEWARKEWLSPVDAISYPVFAHFKRNEGEMKISLKSFGEPGEPGETGQLGYIYVTKQNARTHFGVGRLCKLHKEQTERILKREVEELNDYLNGNYYRCRLYRGGEEILDRGGYRYGGAMLLEMSESWDKDFEQFLPKLSAKIFKDVKFSLSF